MCNVATVGDEGTVRVWDLQAKSLLHMRVSTYNCFGRSPAAMVTCVLSYHYVQDLKSKARALAYSPNGTELAVALYTGDLVILTENLDAIVTQVCVAH